MPALRRSTALSIVAAGAVALGAIGYGGVQLETSSTSAVAPATGNSAAEPARWGGGRPDRSGSGVYDVPGYGMPGSAVPGYDGAGSGSAGSATATATGSTAEATASQLRGVVDIVTTVNFGQAEAAGTGVVLTSDGEVLTNNHVVDGATKITVTVLSTGRSYTATVVGTSPTDDIAVLRLSGASGLTTAPLGDSSTVAVGDSVTGVGNAGNDAGTSASAGEVTALDQEVTASDGAGSTETVTGMIETSAPIRSGDSGGPLLDAEGKVVGIDTAAQTSGFSGVTVAGYAIPIDHALDVASQILAGVDTDTIHQGVPAFLGVQTAGTAGAEPTGAGATTGVPVVGVVTGSAAAAAGLQAGDTITSVGGTTVSSPTDLTAALADRSPGDRVSVSWTDGSGTSHTRTVTLGSGPAD